MSATGNANRGFRHIRAALAFVAALVVLSNATGCALTPPAAPSGPTLASVQLTDREAFMSAAVTQLREWDLPPERVDWVGGQIVTQPTTSGQWFEPWRVDARGGYQAMESNLHTIQRVVTIDVRASEGGAATSAPGLVALDAPPPLVAETQPTSGLFDVQVTVEKFRYSAPERQITTASGALRIYNEDVPTTEGVRRSASPNVQWVPLGRDAVLEQYVLQRLMRAAQGEKSEARSEK